MQKIIILICLTLITITGIIYNMPGTAIALWIGYVLWRIYTDPPDEVYVVHSRDRGPISVHYHEEDAQKSQQSQITSEEMSGGRPSVGIKKMSLSDSQALIVIE